jgi:ribonuclease HI
MIQSKYIIIYTDGSSLGNPGPGGYGVILKYNRHVKELSGGFRQTTNNRMEIYAPIVGLRAIKNPSHVTLYTDSQYVINAITKGWVYRWRAQGWMRNKKEPALNIDLWEHLLPLLELHEVEFVWVRGHNGLPENERCDRLAKLAAQKDNLPPDEGFEHPVRAQPSLFTQ